MYRDPREPAADVTPLFKFPLASDTVAQWKREISARIDKDFDDAGSVGWVVSFSIALDRIDRVFCDAVPSPLRQQCQEVQRACIPKSNYGKPLTPGRCRYITFAAFRPDPTRPAATEPENDLDYLPPSDIFDTGQDRPRKPQLLVG